MMDLYDKIKTIYPDLDEKIFFRTVEIRNDSDGRGDYIAAWNHPTLPKPTDEELA